MIAELIDPAVQAATDATAALLSSDKQYLALPVPSLK